MNALAWGIGLLVLGGIGIGWWLSRKTSGEILDDQPVQQAIHTARQNPSAQMDDQQQEQWEQAQQFGEYLRQLWQELHTRLQNRQQKLQEVGVQQCQEDDQLMRITFLGGDQTERGRIEFTTLWVGWEKPQDTIPYVLFWDDIQSQKEPGLIAQELIDTLLEELQEHE